MSDGFGSSTGLYDVARESYSRVVAAAPSQKLLVLEQMVAAMASVVVEYAPDEAERIWRGAGLDVRLSPPHPSLRDTFSRKGRREVARRFLAAWPYLYLGTMAAVVLFCGWGR